MIYRDRLEVDIVDRCNLKCKSCGHASPMFKGNYYTFDQYKEDIEAMSKVFHVRELVLMGGEPLLTGNKIKDYIQTAKESGIGERVRMVTNGILLHKIDLNILTLLDSIWISLYPIKEKEAIEAWYQENKHHFKELSLMPRTHFSNCMSRERLSDERAEQSFKNCGAMGGNGCNLMYRGHFYICAPSGKFKMILPHLQEEGCPIHEDGLEDRLNKYLDHTTKSKLNTCSHCHGYIGEHPWVQEKTP